MNRLGLSQQLSREQTRISKGSERKDKGTAEIGRTRGQGRGNGGWNMK